MARQFRADIQALRAFAVAIVIVFHLWPNRLAGGFIGVDVFFVISGFLITSHIIRDMDLDRFKASQFWARRIRRLLPASFTVIVATLIAVVFLATNTEKLTLLWESVSSTFYFENWTLAFNAVDYLGQDNAVSPVQHFWSLSVEEQFYMVWPLLLLLGYFLAKKLRIANFRINGTVILSLLTLASLTYSIYLTETDPKFAYFSTATRAWEFATGALVAFIPANVRIPKILHALGIGISTLALVLTAYYFDKSLPFPGYWAAIPVAATALIIWFGVNDGWLLRTLSWKPIQHLGDISYSAYLWHWPPIILIPMVTNTSLTTLQKVAVIVFTLVVATLSRRFIEIPVIEMRSNIRAFSLKTFAVTAAASLMIAGGAVAASNAAQIVVTKDLQNLNEAPVQQACFGAAARQADGTLCDNPAITAPITPTPDLAMSDSPSFEYPQCLTTNRADAHPKVCALGDRNGTKKILLLGDSHAAQFRATIDLLGKSEHWSVDSVSKGGCTFSYASRVQDSVLASTCKTWVKENLALIAKNKYDLVITSAVSGVQWVTKGVQYPNPVDGFVAVWKKVNASGARLLAIKDNPRPVKAIAKCLTAHPTDYLKSCALTRKTAIQSDPMPAAVKKVNNAKTAVLNLDNIYCGKTICEPIIGKVMVYRDENHITSTFSKTLQPMFLSAINTLFTK